MATPQSANEAILQNMLGASNEIKQPQSRVEKLLQDIAGQMPEANPSEGTTTGTLERLKIGDDIYTVEGGGSGTSDYDALNNKPQIAGTTLSGNKSLADLGIASATTVSGILDGASIDSFADVETALAGKQDTLTFDNTPTENSTNPVKSGGIYSALAGKVDTGIVADDFDSTASYVIGNYCIENGKLYRFKANHSGAWSASDVDEIQITGELATLKSGLTTLDNEVNGDATTYPYADVITIEDAVPSNLADCNVKVEPVQDLHGQSAPYVGGAGKNKLPLVLADIKTANTDGTWADNVYSINNGTITVNTDDGGNITSIKANGTFNDATNFILCENFILSTSCIMNGCPADGGIDKFIINWQTNANDTGEGVYITNPTTGNVRIQIMSGVTVSNKEFYPMIRLSTETDATFAPYTNICPITGHTAASVRSQGRNVWDEEWELGKFNDATGLPDDANDRIRTKNFIPINPDTLYYIKCSEPTRQYFYDENKNYLGNAETYTRYNTTFRTVSNAHYMKYFVAPSYGTTYNNDICLNFSDTDFNGQYAHYAGMHTATIQLGDTIYGGTVDFDSGVMTVTKAIVDLGSLTWTLYPRYSNMPPRFGVVISGIKNNSSCVCESYQNVPVSAITLDSDFVIFGSENYINIVNSNYDDATEFKTSVDGIHCVYELATPLTVQLTPTQIQLLKGTNTLTASTGQISVTVNGVSGAIGAVQEQVNDTDAALAELAEQLPSAPTTDGAYVLTVTVADGTPTYSWESAT